VDKPVILLVNDDVRTLEALTDDVRRRFATHYKVVGERSPATALETLNRLAGQSGEVALLVAAQTTAGTNGVDFLLRAHELCPAAKRMLLIGRGTWASGEAVAHAMTLGQIDGYLFNPWWPVEQWLYLPVSELLAEWEKARAPTFEPVRIIGQRWQARAHEIRDFFSRGGMPYGFYESDSQAGRRLLEEAGQDGARLPVLVFYTGHVLVDPTIAEIVEALGFKTRPDDGVYDVVIVGAGPAGLAAGVYAASEGLRTLLLEPEVPGGQAGTSSRIRNYLGFPRGISGEDLTYRALEQAWLFGADIVLAQSCAGLVVRDRDRVVLLADGNEVLSDAVVIATGITWRRLDVPALEALVGAGVFYGAAGSEARAMLGQDVFVVGAGNSAGQAAIHLARYAASVTILARGETLRASMSDYLVQEITQTPNIRVRLRTEVVDGAGRARLERLTLRDRVSGALDTMPAAALFVLIGGEPRTQWLAGTLERDDRGFVLTGGDLLQDGKPPQGWPLSRPPALLETSVPGVFAVGDARYRSVKRVAPAVGAGAIAVQLIHEYLEARRLQQAHQPSPEGTDRIGRA
jgi:thioredoxin reductase (NADPH)